MPSPVAIDPSAIQMPLSTIVGGFIGLCGAIGTVFWLLVDSHKKQNSDLLRLIDEGRQDRAKQWAIVERFTAVMDRGNFTRLMEVAAYPHIAPQIKNDAEKIALDIREAEAAARRREQP